MNIEEAKKTLKLIKSVPIIYECEFTMNNKELSELKQAIETILSELDKREAVIDEMAEKLVEAHGWFYSEFDNFTKEDWKEYFYKKVEEGK